MQRLAGKTFDKGVWQDLFCVEFLEPSVEKPQGCLFSGIAVKSLIY